MCYKGIRWCRNFLARWMGTASHANAIIIERAVASPGHGVHIGVDLWLIGPFPVNRSVGCPVDQQLDRAAGALGRRAQLAVDPVGAVGRAAGVEGDIAIDFLVLARSIGIRPR